jgi:uncharacterized protein YeaO (DUF488 family)
LKSESNQSAPSGQEGRIFLEVHILIRVTSIRHIKDSPADEVWLIVRSLKKPIAGTKQVKALSPSNELFRKYLQLKAAGNWSEQTFADVYVPTFLAEMQNKEARAALNYLYLQDKRGKNICLACFCPDERLCHRSIVAGLLQGCGCDVQTDSGDSYTKYFALFKS